MKVTQMRVQFTFHKCILHTFYYHFELIPITPVSIEIGGHWYENVTNACGIFAPFIEHVQANSGSQALI